MTDKPPPKAAVLYIVSEFKNGIWREILATHSETDAGTLLKKLGTKGKIEETRPRTKRR